MDPFPSPIVRLRVGPPGGEAPRPHPQHPHPPSVVAQVKALIETTTLPHRVIAKRAGVDKGTVSRWRAAHGWTRPPGASLSNPRPDQRYRPVLIGRALAQRLRAQAERLVSEIERAPAVDPAALAQALGLLAQAREEQQVRRTRKRLPPPPPSPAEADAAREADAFAKKDRRRRTREEAALLGWKGRYSRRNRHHAWMLEKE